MSTRIATIRLLQAEGHSPTKALEIAIDYERGNEHAETWVQQARDRAALRRQQKAA